MKDIDIKNIVREKYSAIVNQNKESEEAGCCGSTGCCSSDNNNAIMSDSYEGIEGYNTDADLGLGCGLPTEFAQIKLGDTVVDLGSGAGNDCFVARKLVGDKGKIIGIDMTEGMIKKAKKNTDKLGFKNIEFIFGDIENIPIKDDIADVVVSNCVLNLAPNKEKVLSETYRILKTGGHFSISDIVLKGKLPETIKKNAEMYAGCVSGAMQYEDYINSIKNAGFTDVKVQKEKNITLPKKSFMSKYLSDDESLNFQKNNIGIYSITVYAKK